MAIVMADPVLGHDIAGRDSPSVASAGGQVRNARIHTNTSCRAPKAVADTTVAIGSGIRSANDATNRAVGISAKRPSIGVAIPQFGLGYPGGGLSAEVSQAQLAHSVACGGKVAPHCVQ